MNIWAVLRYTLLVASVAVMIFGVLVTVGIFVPQNFLATFPENYRIIFGILIFLYGLYRFVVTYIRQENRR